MKIYSNPIPQGKQIIPAASPPKASESKLTQLQARNAEALHNLSLKQTAPTQSTNAKLKQASTPAEVDDQSITETHVHEIHGSTHSARCRNCGHKHSFGGVTGIAIPVPGGHIHALHGKTEDLFQNTDPE